MKYIFELNSRVSENQSAEEKYSQVIESLKSVNPPWGVDSIDIPFSGFGKESVAILDLERYTERGIKCTIFFRYRNLLEDSSLCDDRIYLEFNPKKIDYSQLTQHVFLEYVKLFNAYRAAIYDKDLIYLDFERSRNKNLRNTIYRFYPVCYFDRELCRRALNESPEKIASRLKDIESVHLVNDGLLINNNSHLLTTAEANLFSETIFDLLGVAQR